MKELLFFKLDSGVYPIFIYPQYFTIFICAEKKTERQLDKQTNKQHLTLDCPAKTESARTWRAFLNREEGNLELNNCSN